MTILDTIGMFYVILATGLFTACWLIAAVYVLTVRIQRVREWIATGKRVQAEEEELRRIAK